MRIPLVSAVIAIAMIGLSAPATPGTELEAPESCLALNPVQPKCTFTITTASTSQTVTGAVGAGTWKVVIKRGKKKMFIKPSGAEPEAIAFRYAIGDKVTAMASSGGSWVLAGHD